VQAQVQARWRPVVGDSPFAADRRILIALPERAVRDRHSVGDRVILYKTALKLQPVMEALTRCRTADHADMLRPAGGED
jgi:hypothetical protein